MQGQEQMQAQGQGMSRGSPAANSLQHAVSSSQPDISTPPTQVRDVYMHHILQDISSSNEQLHKATLTAAQKHKQNKAVDSLK